MPSVILLDVAGVVVGTLAGCGMKKYISGSLNESINLALSRKSGSYVGCCAGAPDRRHDRSYHWNRQTACECIEAAPGNRRKRDRADTSRCIYLVLYQYDGNYRCIDAGI